MLTTSATSVPPLPVNVTRTSSIVMYSSGPEPLSWPVNSTLPVNASVAVPASASVSPVAAEKRNVPSALRVAPSLAVVVPWAIGPLM